MKRYKKVEPKSNDSVLPVIPVIKKIFLSIIAEVKGIWNGLSNDVRRLPYASILDTLRKPKVLLCIGIVIIVLGVFILNHTSSSDSSNFVIKHFKYFQGFSSKFNDLNDVQLVAAKKYGYGPNENETSVIKSGKFDVVETCSYYQIDKLTHSLPYLVPRALDLLDDIGETFRDSTSSKGFPDCKLVVTSLLRTNETLTKLRKVNGNASENSCHLYGTTFDIAYARYEGIDKKYAGKLKCVLAEVLYQMKKDQKCYIKYEYKQGCFHITTR